MSSTSSDIQRVFALQRQHQWTMKASSADERKALLQKLQDAVKAHGDEIIAAVRKDTRKPFQEVQMTEVGGVNGSGMGSYHGHFGFKAFSHERAVYRHQQ